MTADDDRTRVAKRMSSEQSALPRSALGRRARLVAGFAKASAKSLGRTVRGGAGGGAQDIEPEAEVARSLGQLKGVVTKMGQVLGYVDVGLPITLRSALSALQTNAQPLDVHRVRDVVVEDLGDAGRELARAMHPEALSAASVGQVHRATLPDGTAVVVKVLHAGLAEIIARDFGPAMFASRISQPFHAMLGQVRERFLEECDYTLEARRQVRFGDIFRDHDTLVVPHLHAAFCSARVLTSTFMDGLHLDAFLATKPSQEAKNRAGEALFDFYVAPLFKHGIYNCDPHPGNYLFLPDGRVAVVDFGCAREFEPAFVGHLAALTRAVMVDDGDLIHDALVGLGLGARVAYDRRSTQWLLHAFFGPLVRDEVLAFDVSGEIKLREMLRSGWKARKLALSGELVFLLRTFVGLSSVLARLGARANWRRRLETAVAPALVSEVASPGARPLTSPIARALPSHAAAPVSPPTRKPRAPVPSAELAVSRASPASERGARTIAGTSPQPFRGQPPAPASNGAGFDREGRWDIVLLHPGASQIALIRELREVMAMDLRELKDIIDSVPQTLRQGLALAEAEALRKRLETVGARIEVRRA